MKHFPTLKEREIALLRSEFKSGHVLDQDYNIALNENQTIYSIFETLEEALNKTKQILIEKEDIECTLYNRIGQVIYFFRSLDDFYNRINEKTL